MSEPVKNLLIYADGHIEEYPHRLEGMRFIKPESRPDGSVWNREFECNYATSNPDDRKGPWTMVALERLTKLAMTPAQIQEMRDDRLRKVLRAIMGGAKDPAGLARFALETDDGAHS